MALSPGTRLGAYEVLALVGAGGMGEVYRARDTTLGRDVALKLLPERVAADPDRLARFAREAQTLAALNHPNIAHIYGLERQEGRAPLSFIVMELVDGEDLARRIARGPIAIDECRAIARQIAEALETAHDHGIIHRDLKPANIKLNADGTVKVLDFGLAKAIDRADDCENEPPSMSPTMTSPAITAAGVILGTAAYMAPEQAKGRPVDKRADIWAFGVVLFEMLTGRTLFAGESIAETIGLVVTREPDWNMLPAGTPPQIDALLRRCLTKDPRNRLRDIGEARILLARSDDAPAPRIALTRRRRTGIAAGLVGAFALGALGAGIAMRRAPASRGIPIRRFELADAIASASVGPVLSRDGSRVAYVAGNHLRVQALDALESADLGPVPVDTANLFWSPDSASIGFTGETMVRTVPAAGGPAFTVCKIPATGAAQSLVWRADGTILVSVFRNSLYRVAATGGTPEVLLASDPATEVDFHGVTELPGNRLLVATHLRDGDREQYEIYDGKRRNILTAASGAGKFAYTPSGYLLFVRTDANSGVWAVPFADGPLDLSKAVLVEARATRFSAADDGTLLAEIAPSSPPPAELVWFDRHGRITPISGSPIETGRRVVQDLALSPDGRRAVFVNKQSVFVRDLASGLDTRLTFERHQFVFPSWFPTGDRVLYLADVVMTTPPGRGAVGTSFLGKITMQRADGTGQPQQVGTGTAHARVAPDGRSLLFIVDDTGRGRLRIAPIASDGSIGMAQPFFHDTNEPSVRWFDVSPDSRLLAYAAEDISSRVDMFVTDIFITEYPNGTGRWQVHLGGSRPQFSPAGGELFFVSEGVEGAREVKRHFTAVPIASTPPVTLGAKQTLFELGAPQGPDLTALGFSAAPDGRRFLSARLLTPAGRATRQVVLIQNWAAALKK